MNAIIMMMMVMSNNISQGIGSNDERTHALGIASITLIALSVIIGTGG